MKNSSTGVKSTRLIVYYLKSIYKLEGDELTLATYGRSEIGRPRSFAVDDAQPDGQTLHFMTFRRLDGSSDAPPAGNRNGSADNGREAEAIGPLSWNLLGVKLENALSDENEPIGLRIVELRQGGPADEAELRVGDILKGLHKWETRLLAKLAGVLRRPELRPDSGSPKHVRAIFVRGDENYLTTITIEPGEPGRSERSTRLPEAEQAPTVEGETEPPQTTTDEPV